MSDRRLRVVVPALMLGGTVPGGAVPGAVVPGREPLVRAAQIRTASCRRRVASAHRSFRRASIGGVRHLSARVGPAWAADAGPPGL